MSAKDVHLDALWDSCQSLEPDAVRILAYIAKRLIHGQKRYGAINLTTDTRSFARETLEEAADQSVYAAIGMLRIVDSEQAEEERQCVRLNQLARQSRTCFIARAEAAPYTPEQASAESLLRPTP